MFHSQMGRRGPSAYSKHSHFSLPVTPPQLWVGLTPRQQAQGGRGLLTLGLWLPACARSSTGPSGVSSLSAWWWWWARSLGKILSDSGEGRGKGPRGGASPSLGGNGAGSSTCSPFSTDGWGCQPRPQEHSFQIPRPLLRAGHLLGAWPVPFQFTLEMVPFYGWEN